MDKPTLGSQIKKYREASGMTQERLAELLQLSRQAISKWESETARPSTENLIRLAELFQVDLQVFITGQQNVGSSPIEDYVAVPDNPVSNPASEPVYDPVSEQEQNQLPPESSPHSLSLSRPPFAPTAPPQDRRPRFPSF